MPHHTSLILILTAGFVLAFVFGALANRLRLSPLVGYVLAGVIVGPFTPGFVGDASLAPQLAEIGVILLMFGVGLHFSIEDLLAVRKTALPSALLQIPLFTAIGWAVAVWLFGWSHGAGLVYGLALSVASTVVLLRALETRGLVDTDKGRVAIGLLIVEDLVMVLALVLLPAIAGFFTGAQAATPVELAKTIGITLLKVSAFVALMLTVGQRLIPWILRRTVETGARELVTLCVLAIAMGVAFGSASMFGVSFALGAFFAGTILNSSEFSHEAADQTLPLRDAFAVLFFVSVGMLFDPRILLERPLEVFITFLIIVGIKSFFGFHIVNRITRSRGTGWLVSSTLSQIGEFSFILASLGLSLKMLPKDGHDLILAGAILSIIANPFMMTIYDRWAAKQSLGVVPADGDASFPLLPAPSTPLEGHTLVIGFGRVGQEIARALAPRGVSMAIADVEETHIARARSLDLPAILGNAVNPRVLEAMNPSSAIAAIVALPAALETAEIIETLRSLNPGLSIVARAHSESALKHYLSHGADAAVLAERELGQSLAEMVLALPIYRGDRRLTPH